MTDQQCPVQVQTIFGEKELYIILGDSTVILAFEVWSI